MLYILLSDQAGIWVMHHIFLRERGEKSGFHLPSILILTIFFFSHILEFAWFSHDPTV